MRDRIVVVGSLNADLVSRVEAFPAPGETVFGSDFAIHPGGKGANQAVAAARLGGRVAMIGQVGDDAYGEMLRRSLASVGVDTSHVDVDPAAPTGVGIITIDARGQNQIVVVSGANATVGVDAFECSREMMIDAAVVLLQLEIPIETVAAAARAGRENDAIVILDPAPAREVPSEIIAAVDYVTPNESELAMLTGAEPGVRFDVRDVRDRARRLLDRGAKRVIVKMGETGAMFVDAESLEVWPAFAVEAVDTTAAGDAFNGAFAVACSRGLSVSDAGRYAVAAASCSVTKPGAQPGMPTAAEVDRMLATGHVRREGL